MASSRKGGHIVRLAKPQIAARREMVRQLALKGYRTHEIANALLEVEATRHLLANQANPVKTVEDDIGVLRELAAPAVAKLLPLNELYEYRERQLSLLNVAWDRMHDPHVSAAMQARWASIYAEAAAALGRSGGVPVDKPAFQVDLWQLNQAGVWGARHPDGNGIEPAHDGMTIEGEAIQIEKPTSPVTAPGGFGLVDIHTFATHPDYCALDLSDKPMQDRILREFAKAGSGYNELVCICGRRSGKGTIGSVLVWYKMYRLMEIANPQRYYGLTPGQTIGTVNMALSEDQAKKYVFKHCKDRLNHGGRWFQELRGFCETHIPNYSIDLELRLPKNLLMMCGHSKATSKVGGTNIGIVYDEISKYKTNEGVDNAEQVYQQMKASTSTFGEDALIASFASPEWELDYGMLLLKMALEYNDSNLEDRCAACRPMAEQPSYQPIHTKAHPRMFGIQMETWTANTSYSFEYLWDTQNGAANPRAFWREFGAKPSQTEEGYYPNPERWDKQVDMTLVRPYDNAGRLRAEWTACCDSRRFVHVDLAVSRDAAGVAMAHKPVPGCRYYTKIRNKAKEWVDNEKAKSVVVDLVLQIKPRASSSSDRPEIDFAAVRALMTAWSAAPHNFPIRNGKVTYDGFQSVDSRQILKKLGFRTGLLSVDANLEPHDTLQELINSDDLAYPPDPILIREAKQLRLKNGRKVDHPPGGSKDVVDAVAAAVFNAYKRGGRTRFIGGAHTSDQKED